MKDGFYTTTSNNRLSGWTKNSKALPKPSLHPKKHHGHCLGGLLSVWSTPAFWIPADYIWEIRSANQWDAQKTEIPAASIGQQKGPNSLGQRLTTHLTTNASKVKQIGLQSFASSATFTWPLANLLPLLQASRQLFARKTLPKPAGSRKCFPKVHWIP